MWKNCNCALLVGMQNAAAARENRMTFPQKQKTKQNIKLPYDPKISPLGIYTQKSESRDLSRYLYIHTDNSIIHNSQKVEANQGSTEG